MAASAWRTSACSSLSIQTWRVFDVSGIRYAVKSFMEEDGYELLVTDFSRCWRECLEGEGLTKRCKSLNQHIEAPSSTILKNLQDHLSEQKETAEYQFKVDEGGTLLTLSVDSSLSGLPFKWSFHCKLSQDGKVAEHLTLPLLAMVQELSRQQEEMAKLLRRKDKEIDDYKVLYGPPTRRGLVTPVYDDKVFMNEMRTSQDFQSGVLSSDTCLSTNNKLQSLYKDVSRILQCARHSKDGVPLKEVGEVGGATATPSASTGSWLGRVPRSFLPEPPPQVESPKKQQSSPNRETELQRREALRKQLEGNELKSKKKKRKLI